MINKFFIKKTFKKIDTYFFFRIVSSYLFYYFNIFIFFNHNSEKKRLVWGSIPILNNKYWSSAMQKSGFVSETYVTHYYDINTSSDWDKILKNKYKFLPFIIRTYIAFLESLFLYDVYSLFLLMASL